VNESLQECPERRHLLQVLLLVLELAQVLLAQQVLASQYRL